MSEPRVEVVRDEGALDALEAEWSALVGRDPDAPIFLTPEWLGTWWRHFGRPGALRLLVARAPDGTLEGLLPMMAGGGPGPPRLRLLGGGIVASDHLDLIAMPARRTAVAAAMIAALERERWGLIEMEGLAARSPLVAALGGIGDRRLERGPLRCAHIRLPDDWEDYLREALSANRRQQLRRRQRALERAHPGAVEYRRVESAAELPAAFARLLGLSRARWAGRPAATSFDDPRFVAYHRDVSALALARDWLRFYELVVDGRVIATQYAFAYRGVVFDYQRGFDPDWHEFSPGHLLFAHLIREAIREGAREVDMLRGEEPYKASWQTATRDDHRLLVGRGAGGRLWLHAMGLYDQAADVAKRRLPPAARDWLAGRLQPG